ncbi:MAG: MerR family transcriptional regulator, partial [Flavobacterium sp.]
GYKTVYLGESMPIDNLKDMKKHFDSIIFVTYLTVQPDRDSVNEYVRQMEDQLLDNDTELWFTGWLSQFIDKENRSERIVIFKSIAELVEKI